MRLADTIFRRGHLSERALADLCLTGARPAHLEHCDLCAERAIELGRWLDDVRAMGIDEADAAFPAERLAAQQSHILKRIEQLDRPARVIAFPGRTRDRLVATGHGVRLAWVGVAAAAGIVLGLLGGQVTNHIAASRTASRQAAAAVTQPLTPMAVPAQTASLELLNLDEDDGISLDATAALDAYTPHSVDRSELVVLRTNRGR